MPGRRGVPVAFGCTLALQKYGTWHGDLECACYPPHTCPPTPSPAAAAFHCVLDGATIRPMAPPSELPDQQVSEGAEYGR